MRLYTFVNFYLSGMQNGVQSAHALGELMVKYRYDDSMLTEWLEKHKTMIVLNGGNNLAMNDTFNILRHLDEQGIHYPYVKFHEDDASLGGLLTCVAVVLPFEVYEMARKLRFHELNAWDMYSLPQTQQKLVEKIAYSQLASS